MITFGEITFSVPQNPKITQMVLISFKMLNYTILILVLMFVAGLVLLKMFGKLAKSAPQFWQIYTIGPWVLLILKTKPDP